MQVSSLSRLTGLLAGLALLATPAFSQTNTFSGRGTAVSADVLGVTTTLGDTGALPPAGGNLSTSLINVSVPGLLTAKAISASASGSGNQSQSNASISTINLSVARLVNVLSAELIESQATADCTNGSPSVSGGSTITNLVVLGAHITVTGSPNQTIALPLGLGSLVLNEQVATANSIAVNAVHLTITGIANVVLSHSEADIHCGQVPGCNGDIVTGTGNLKQGTPTNDISFFGFSAQKISNQTSGTLTYLDQGSTFNLVSTAINSYTIVNATTRTFGGLAKVNNVSGFTFTVTVSDIDSPSPDPAQDTFSITVKNASGATVYHASGNVLDNDRANIDDDGKIELFNPCTFAVSHGAAPR